MGTTTNESKGSLASMWALPVAFQLLPNIFHLFSISGHATHKPFSSPSHNLLPWAAFLNKALCSSSSHHLFQTAQIAGTCQGKMARLCSSAASGPGSSIYSFPSLGTAWQLRQEERLSKDLIGIFKFTLPR